MQVRKLVAALEELQRAVAPKRLPRIDLHQEAGSWSARAERKLVG